MYITKKLFTLYTYLIECLDETNDPMILLKFIKKTIQIIVASSESTVHHLTFTKIMGLIIIYVNNDFPFLLSSHSYFHSAR